MKNFAFTLLLLTSLFANGASYFDRAKDNFDVGTKLPFIDNLKLKIEPKSKATCVQKSDPNDLQSIRFDVIRVDPDMALGPVITVRGEGTWDLLSDGEGELNGASSKVDFTLRKGHSIDGGEYWITKWAAVSGHYFETYCWWPK